MGFTITTINEHGGPQWPSGVAGLGSDHRQAPLCGFNYHSDKDEDLSQYDPGC